MISAETVKGIVFYVFVVSSISDKTQPLCVVRTFRYDSFAATKVCERSKTSMKLRFCSCTVYTQQYPHTHWSIDRVCSTAHTHTARSIFFSSFCYFVRFHPYIIRRSTSASAIVHLRHYCLFRTPSHQNRLHRRFSTKSMCTTLPDTFIGTNMADYAHILPHRRIHLKMK